MMSVIQERPFSSLRQEQIFGEVKELLRDLQGVRHLEKLTLDTKLAGDLGIDGDDAVAFMEAFAQQFEVEMTNFEFHKHFSEEGEPVLRLLYYKLIKRQMPEFVPVTIGDLVRAVDCHKWLL